ncbi:hypothetical protein GCM10022251_25000 [Phytohabitans flavus]|uniref:Uncharacterized protein n=1 Tax=Phytohabitans flavus TaxID=1076124 RepID=A0A6F8XR56_9ACTN|nr:aroma-sacti cluster domain-containing protein [Phytohabitans flavus]BCB76296.1 hypothetical protein Pflav_027060 [Phytohabitans flavus]
MSQTSRLAALGLDLSTATEEQRTVIDGLSTEEVDVLSSIKQRVDAAAGGDVEGHVQPADDVGFLIFF